VLVVGDGRRGTGIFTKAPEKTMDCRLQAHTKEYI